MHAAVVDSFDRPPAYREYGDPLPSEGSVLVDVLASALHPRVRSQAAGSHYASTDELPLIPGIDGVGRGPDGVLRYFLLPDTTLGAMAERTLIDPRRSIVLPDDVDPVRIAAAMNPAMSSWVALRRRIEFEKGQRVLVLGATGNAGRMAVREILAELPELAAAVANVEVRRVICSSLPWGRVPGLPASAAGT
jgi:NADPH:quinone reductase-like Zn-dependent oxidoreductase